MNRHGMVAALALLVAAPAVLAGQEDAPRARERDRVRVYTWNENRGRIGVVVSTEANATTDRLGARIEGVTPGTPAERAGIKAGDVITKFNGTALGGAPADASDESGPGMKLLELARVLKDSQPEFTLELLFLDGEEAVNWDWAGADNTYGSRHYVTAGQADGSKTTGATVHDNDFRTTSNGGNPDCKGETAYAATSNTFTGNLADSSDPATMCGDEEPA